MRILLTLISLRLCYCQISPHPKVLMISLDGFGERFFIRNQNPILWKFGQLGVKADHLIPMFPAKTPINHFGPYMGMYSENHGATCSYWINENGERDFYGYRLFHFKHPEKPVPLPIWTLNERVKAEDTERATDASASTSKRHLSKRVRHQMKAKEIARYSAAWMWASTEFEYAGHFLTHFVKWVEPYKWQSKFQHIDQVIKWMTDDQKPANLAFLYFDQPDKFIHDHGTEHPMLDYQLKQIDEQLVYLFDGMARADLLDVTDIIVTSDHGMAEHTMREYVDFYPFTDNEETYVSSDEMPFIQIRVKPEGDPKKVYKDLQNSIERTGLKVVTEKDKNGKPINWVTLPKFKLWKNREIPEEWHFKGPRVPDFVILSNMGFVFLLKKWTPSKIYTVDGKYMWRYGVHGWSGNHPLMNGIFLASGPSFERGLQVPAFENVHLYPLLMKILKIKKSALEYEIDGKLEVVEHLLRKDRDNAKKFVSPLRGLLAERKRTLSFSVIVLILIFGELGSLFVAASTKLLRKKK